MKYLFIFLLVTCSCGLNAQDSDIVLLRNAKVSNPVFDEERIVKFGITNDSVKITKYNPVGFIFSMSLYFYQKVISPQIFATCLYSPSCSEYSRLLFKRYGFLGGLITTSDRLSRCDRISATSIHPISISETDGKVHESTDRYSFINILKPKISGCGL